MRLKDSVFAMSLLAAAVALGHGVAAQEAPTSPQAPPPPGAQTAPSLPGEKPSNQGDTRATQRRIANFNAGEQRPTEDPAQVARGKTLFAINCRSCHGADLRGGDLGGPNLLRSQVALSDQHGEKIVPIIHGARQNMGMPAIPLNDADAQAVAAYVRSVISTIQGQGAPPSEGHEPPSIVVGNAKEGEAFFAAKCSGCHSASGDMKGYASKFSDLKKMQSAWVAGGREYGDESSAARTPTADVTLASGEQVSGQLEKLDDFIVTVKLADGTERSFERNGDTPKVVVHDPMEVHRKLWNEYTDKDIHDVTAYLVTLK